MSTTCQNCGGRAQLFLCGHCTAELRQMLTDLPWWIDRLAEAAVGHAKLGDGGRQTRTASGGLVEYTDERPAYDNQGFAIGTTEGQQRLERDVAAGKFGRDRVLAAGKVNARASRLLDRVQNSLTTIVRDLCETRGVPVHSVRAVPPSFIGPLLPNDIRVIYRSGAQLAAAWLSEHVTAIAADESAGQWFAELHRVLGNERHDGEIPKLINRPIPMRFLGKCPTWLEDKRAVCGTELRCRQGEPEIYCRNCRTTHNSDRLQLLLMNDLERQNLTFDKILKANLMQPAEFQISERMIRRWRQHSKLKVYGYLRPCSCGHPYAEHNRKGACKKCAPCEGFNGREVINRHSDDDEPLYRWPDVRRLRTEVPTRKAKAG